MFMRIRKLRLVALAALVFAMLAGVDFTWGACGCSALPTECELAGRGAVPAGTRCGTMRRGRALVITECTGCHRFFWPCEYSPMMWAGLMQSMGNRIALSRRQIGDMTRYMVAASRATRRSRDRSLLQAALEEKPDPKAVQRGKELAFTSCVECHGFYHPSGYPANAWPGIVQSMGEMSSLTYNEMLDIARYHVQESRKAVAGQ